MTSSLLRETRFNRRVGVPESAVSVRGLTKRFPRHRTWAQTLRHPFKRDYATVLHGVDCDVRRGEFFGLLGPNGAGKTTLFKILATLILPDAGSVRVEGHDAMVDGAGVRRVLAPVIADERSLHWRLSARENLRLFAVLQGVAPAIVRHRVTDLLEAVGLADEGQKLVGAFSSGMKQRLLIARALIVTPQVLLLDEPTRSLDPVTARDFRAFLRAELVRNRGCTVLLATHNTEEALQLCDRVAVLNRGKILATGAPATLKEQFGDERYRLSVRDPAGEVPAALTTRGIASRRPHGEAGPDGWSTIEVDVPGGAERIAELLQVFVSRGVAVARCERIELSLADLIERVLQRA